MNKTIKNFLKDKILFRIFYYGQFLGFDILPRHYYSEIPSIHKLRIETEWRKPFSMIGVPGYGPIEAQFLRAFIVAHCPSQIVQVGCGVSAAICLRASR